MPVDARETRSVVASSAAVRFKHRHRPRPRPEPFARSVDFGSVPSSRRPPYGSPRLAHSDPSRPSIGWRSAYEPERFVSDLSLRCLAYVLGPAVVLTESQI